MSLWQIDSRKVFYLRFLFVCACGWMLYVHNLIKEIDTELLKGRTNWKHLFCPPKLLFPTTFFPTPKWDLSAWVFSMHNWFENPHVRGRMLASLVKIFTCNTSWFLSTFKMVEDAIQLFQAIVFMMFLLFHARVVIWTIGFFPPTLKIFKGGLFHTSLKHLKSDPNSPLY